MKKLPVPVGKKFGHLTVVSDGASGMWMFLCDCGVKREMYSGGVRDGKTVSCGCHRAANAKKMFTTHGKTGTDSYKSWRSMHQRVKVDPDYIGVVICDRWNDFDNFFDDMGERPKGKSIDRIKAELGYQPGNCRWATAKEQSVNRKNVVMLTFEGKTMCLADWAKEVGIERGTLKNRIKRGWSHEKAFTTSV